MAADGVTKNGEARMDETTALVGVMRATTQRRNLAKLHDRAWPVQAEAILHRPWGNQLRDRARL